MMMLSIVALVVVSHRHALMTSILCLELAGTVSSGGGIISGLALSFYGLGDSPI